MLTDGFCSDPGALLTRCARVHELLWLRVVDPIDAGPRGGAPVRVQGAEHGGRGIWGRSGAAPQPLSAERLRRSGVEFATLRAGAELAADLRSFFAKRPRART